MTSKDYKKVGIKKSLKSELDSFRKEEKPKDDVNYELTVLTEYNSQLKQMELEKLRQEVEKLRQEAERFREDTELRRLYSFKAFKVVKKSLWGWAILLLIYGVIKFLTRHEYNGQGFEIFSDNVLIAITTATTLNIFAAFLSLIRGLFPSIESKEKDKKEKSKS